MEPSDRGLRDRLRDWRRGKSRARDTQKVQNDQTKGDTLLGDPRAAPVNPSGSSLSSQTLSRASQPAPSDQVQSAHSSTSLQAKHDENAPTRPVVRTPGSTSQSTNDYSALLWKQVYEEVRIEHTSLLEHYEAVLKDSAGLPPTGNFRDQLADIAMTQSKKVANKQWRFRWLGKQQSARDTAERLLDLTSRSAALVSIGMSYAPVYVSIPWSAVTALIPFMMNDIKEHRGSIEGLEIVSKLTFSYQMAENAFLGQPETRDLYAKSVTPLYKKIIEYQALAIEYFGKSTLCRLGKNVTGSMQWQDMPSKISRLDQDTQRALHFLGQQTQTESLTTITALLAKQQSEVEKLIQSMASKRNNANEVADWVSAISVERDHRDVRQKLGDAHFQSGQWFMEDDMVRKWCDWTQSSRYLWLRDGVGTGKSSVTSILIEELNGAADGLTAFFYCSRKVDKHDERATARNNHENILRSILAQTSIATDGITVADGVKRRFERDPRRILSGTALSAEDCVSLLDDIFSSTQNCRYTIAIDALDECDDFDAVLQCLEDASNSHDNVRLFFSSRLQVKVQDYFPEARIVSIQTRNARDIEKFLDLEIPRRRVGSGMTDSQSDRLRRVLIERASGMFMWVKLQLNLFLHEIKSHRIRLEEDIETRLLSLERSEAVGEDQLYGAYDDVYTIAIGANEQVRRKELVVTALRWVLSAFRTLTLRELAYATSIMPDGSIASSVQEGLVLEFCSNLLVEDTSGIVRLAHLSVRNYLEDREPPEFEQHLNHRQAALTCLYFANSPRFHEMNNTNIDLLQEGHVRLTKGFYSYVTSHWHKHCRLAEEDKEIEQLMEKFMDLPELQKVDDRGMVESALPMWLGVHVIHVDGTNYNISEIFSVLLTAMEKSTQHAHDVVIGYIARGGSLSDQTPFGNTLLHETIRLHLSSTAKALIDTDVTLDTRNSDGNSALHFACMYREEEVLQHLLYAGSDVNARNTKGETPLHMAVIHKLPGAVETLLSANAGVAAKDYLGNTPFHYAIVVSGENILHLLLMSGYNGSTKNDAGLSALSLAVQLKRPRLAKLLSGYSEGTKSDKFGELERIGWPGAAKLPSQDDISPDEDAETLSKDDISSHVYSVATDYKGLKSFCQYCDFARWMTDSRRGSTYPYFDSVDDLARSANGGCPICTFFRDELSMDQNRYDPAPEGRLTIKIQRSSAHGRRVGTRDILKLYAGDITLLTYDVCTDSSERSVSALDWITTHTLDESPTTPRSLNTINSWMTSCSTTHHDCHQATESSLPHRVVDLGVEDDSDVRLLTTFDGDVGRYVYLSYIWPSHENRLVLEATNALELSVEGIPLNNLHRIHREAIRMTRSLGFRYLWIDALCIMQRNHQDLMQEVSRMPQYYQKATMVLVATGSGYGDYPLLYARKQPELNVDIIQMSTKKGRLLEGYPKQRVCLRRPLRSAYDALFRRILSRGWLVVEVTTSSKLLIMDSEQNYWHCQTCVRSEGSALEEGPVVSLSPRSSSEDDTDPTQSFASWYDFVHIYSSAKFTAFKDRLYALSAASHYFDLHATIMASIWKDDFRNGILWYRSGGPFVGVLRYDLSSTWSWISNEGAVRYDFLVGTQHDRLSTDVSFQLVDLIPQPPINEMLHRSEIAHARVKAMVLPCSWPIKQNPTCFFDDLRSEKAWQRGEPFLLLFVCPWSVSTPFSARNARGIGLILRNDIRGEAWKTKVRTDPIDCSKPLIRVGLFLMPSFDPEMEGWQRRQITIA